MICLCMLLMYILTFPAFSAHLEKGRGVLPPNMLLLLRRATATPFVWSFSVHVSSFASFQNIFLAFSRPSRIICSAVPAVTKGRPRSHILYLLVTDEKYVLSAHAPYHYGHCHPFPMNLLQGALHFLTVSKKKFGYLYALHNEVKALRMTSKCVLQMGSLTNMVFNDERSNWGMGV